MGMLAEAALPPPSIAPGVRSGPNKARARERQQCKESRDSQNDRV
eukprot:CAMPEP_0177795692 /NCGR_PEP_ID=MMETSP0491_2-20121128/26377_1 /TAXON_ID=63592 /ORGANISM="Tetraselmis chuii, Strain PLY429" /LENGTH=44 /DNA_ID= /DNA_START= /DNA_END= /DNA_ORIENTATION=